jgi:hypothetical protein
MTKNATIYIPSGPDASARWQAVESFLRAAGFSDIRPAPMPSQSFQALQDRGALPILISRAGV